MRLSPPSANGHPVDASCPEANAEVAYLVDDEISVRKALAAFLNSAGVEVVCFGSATEYLEYNRRDGAACLIIDLQMPHIGGLELQKRLSDAGGPPVVFISGRGDIPSTVQAMKAGAIEFLTKPVNPEQLLATVKSAFQHDRSRRRQRADLHALQKRLALLSPRERDVFPLVVKGLLNKQAAAALGITEVTLQIHRSNVMKKMGAESFADLVRMASALGIGADPSVHV